MSHLSNDDFRKLVNASLASSQVAAASRAPAITSRSKSSGLPSQSKSFKQSGLGDAPTAQAQKRQQYRDRAQERRQGKDEDAAPTNVVKGLDYELLARVRRGENIYESDSVDKAEDDKYEAGDDDPELEKQLDEILMSNELDKTEVDHVKRVTKSKAEYLRELRRAIDERPKSKFKRIGGPKSPATEEEKQPDRQILSKKYRSNNNKKKEKKSKPPHVSKGPEQIAADQPNDQQENQSHPASLVPPAEETLASQPDKREVRTSPPKINVELGNSAGNDMSDDGDIFEDAGTDYNPFAGIDDEDSLSESSSYSKQVSQKNPKEIMTLNEGAQSTATSHAETYQPQRNYFQRSRSPESEQPKTKPESGSRQSEQSISMMEIIAEADLDTVLNNSRAAKKEISSMKARGLVPLQAFGGDYDIDTDLGGEGRWIDDDEEDAIGKKSRKRKRG
ncbi:hypothetical protein V1525DRAFT_17089 [Lipomyces kononenkoae]|uniref:Uncharacterized protein n=1 Tax=Lipomyces kononenkoae TaxID=34357 RepID=A0ACC3T7R5_LIPKO